MLRKWIQLKFVGNKFRKNFPSKNCAWIWRLISFYTYLDQSTNDDQKEGNIGVNCPQWSAMFSNGPTSIGFFCVFFDKPQRCSSSKSAAWRSVPHTQNVCEQNRVDFVCSLLFVLGWQEMLVVLNSRKHPLCEVSRALLFISFLFLASCNKVGSVKKLQKLGKFKKFYWNFIVKFKET